MPDPPLQSLPEHRGVHPAVVKHIQEFHRVADMDAYRRIVFSRVHREWPDPVPAQVMRLSVDRYLNRLRDSNFAQSFCACCACVTPRSEIQQCVFPLKDCLLGIQKFGGRI
eukprot:8411505-Karenia_brevis.AAC.1